MIHNEQAKIEEVVSVLTPAPGVSLTQVVIDAQAVGAENIMVDPEANHVVITWYRKRS